MLGRDQRLVPGLEPGKPVVSWQFPNPVEGFIPSTTVVEGTPATATAAAAGAPPATPPLHQTTYMTMPDSSFIQAYYTTISAPIDSTTQAFPKPRPTFVQQPPAEGALYVASRPPMQLQHLPSHSSREDDRLSNPSEDLPSRVKLLLSYGGKILPRPSDGRLRYVGGHTRMITVSREISYGALMQKVAEIQNHTISLKYQLPYDDLDALVSVSADEDLENMMEEYDKVEARDANPRLRVFLFTASDYDAPGLGDGSGNSEQQYLEAVNGLSETLSRKHSDSSVQSASTSSPQSNNQLPEPVMGIPQVSQGLPMGAGVLPATFGYVETSHATEFSPETPLVRGGEMVFEDLQQAQVVQLQQMAPEMPRMAYVVPRFPEASPQGVEEFVHQAIPAAQWPHEASTPSTFFAGANTSPWASSTATYSDPSGFATTATPTPAPAPTPAAAPSVVYIPVQIPPEQMNNFEYEKLNMQQQQKPQAGVVFRQPEQVLKADESVYGGTLSGWSVPSTQLPSASVSATLEPEVAPGFAPGAGASSALLGLPDSLVNFLEDSVSAVRTERSFPVGNTYGSGSGSDSSTVTTQMAHSGMDLLTSDDVFYRRNSCNSTASGGSIAASSVSNSSSYALDARVQVLSPKMNQGVVYEAPPLISLESDAFNLVSAMAAPVVETQIMREMASLSLGGVEAFGFTQASAAAERPQAQAQEIVAGSSSPEVENKVDRSLDTSDLQAAAGKTTGGGEGSGAAMNERDEAALIDLTEPELEDESISAEECEAIARARGLQVIKHDDLEEIRELGSGTFGTVFHGKWRGTDVAIKRIKSSCFFGPPSEQARLKDDFWSEACILAHLHHPNVVAFYGVVPDSPGGTLATVTEFMVNGSLKQVLHKKDRIMDKRRRVLVAMDAAFGMEYLHNKKIIHFDLKGENLLVNMRDPQRPICKVGDLGLSKIKQKTMVTGGVRGTLPWMAPELLNGKSISVSEKVDVFSFGIVMWELLTGEEPYADLHYGAIIGGIVSNSLRPPIPSNCEPEWRSLMERCWADDPDERPTFPEVTRELRSMLALYTKQMQQQSGGQHQQQQQQQQQQGQQSSGENK